MTKINRRDLIQRFGLAGIMLVPLFRQTRAYAAEKGKRYIQLFKPLGHPDGDRTYFPSGAGNNFSFNGKLTEALEPLRDDLIVFKGIQMYKNGGNSHAEGASRVFTNVQAGSGPGTKAFDFRPPRGPSIDHIIADHLYNENNSPMKHINWSFGAQKNNVVHTTSFPAAGRTASPVVNLEVMYNSVISRINLICKASGAGGNAAALNALKGKKSILDNNLVLIGDAKRNLKLSAEETSKLDQYSEQIRVLEKEISSLGNGGNSPCPIIAPFQSVENSARIRATFDLIVLAVEWELANVVSYQFGGGQDNTRYNDVTNTSYHGLTHGENDQNRYGQVSRHLWGHIAYFLQKLKATKTLDGQNLLDAHAVLISGGEVSDGQNHATNNMPFMVAGRANGYFRTGRIFQTNSNNRMNSHGRLLLAMCRSMGLANLNTVGDADKCPGGPML